MNAQIVQHIQSRIHSFLIDRDEIMICAKMSTKSIIHETPSTPDIKYGITENNSSNIDNKIVNINQLNCALLNHFQEKFLIDQNLNRQLVSFQDNKNRPVYRWYKFKEAFSASLVEYLLNKYEIKSGRLLDPFAGSGTALFAASSLGMDAEGIELLAIGHQIISTKVCLEGTFTKKDRETVIRWINEKPWNKTHERTHFTILKITRDAYPPETQIAIEHYLNALAKENKRVQFVLRFALLCILESISYTRKDGQYLRWDQRSGRRQGIKPFDKGKVLEFNVAIITKLNEIMTDTASDAKQNTLLNSHKKPGEISLLEGSCLEILPTLKDCTFNAIVTSPPYCNRYDYTRTYALELALLGTSEDGLRKLRQTMISCTVENRAKDLLSLNPSWDHIIQIADNQEVLQSILQYLEDLKEMKLINNTGIPRMVRGYFYEMACIIAECHRVLKPGGYMFMVNDNVRYAGASISVDMILSDFAEKFGFKIENILVLPKGKGNSSQQMGLHGRDQLRKCVYIWKKVCN
ncbi:MAG: site-specific DNA-methyltransferase [Nanoarchaeota archaeon]|nr:site-specific DNA-methyltransferase [Nanoarchaeota archaeon]